MNGDSNSPLVGKDELPLHLQEAMLRLGMNPGASYVASAEGWRSGSSVLDLSTPAEAAKTKELAQRTMKRLRQRLDKDGAAFLSPPAAEPSPPSSVD